MIHDPAPVRLIRNKRRTQRRWADSPAGVGVRLVQSRLDGLRLPVRSAGHSPTRVIASGRLENVA